MFSLLLKDRFVFHGIAFPNLYNELPVGGLLGGFSSLSLQAGQQGITLFTCTLYGCMRRHKFKWKNACGYTYIQKSRILLISGDIRDHTFLTGRFYFWLRLSWQSSETLSFLHVLLFSHIIFPILILCNCFSEIQVWDWFTEAVKFHLLTLDHHSHLSRWFWLLTLASTILLSFPGFMLSSHLVSMLSSFIHFFSQWLLIEYPIICQALTLPSSGDTVVTKTERNLCFPGAFIHVEKTGTKQR